MRVAVLNVACRDGHMFSLAVKCVDRRNQEIKVALKAMGLCGLGWERRVCGAERVVQSKVGRQWPAARRPRPLPRPVPTLEPQYTCVTLRACSGALGMWIHLLFHTIVSNLPRQTRGLALYFQQHAAPHRMWLQP